MKSIFASGHGWLGDQRFTMAPAPQDAEAIPTRRDSTSCIGMRLAFLLFAVLFMIENSASAQVVAAGDAGGYNLTVGATASGDYLQYGSRKMLGINAIVDIDTKRRTGFEGEAQFLIFHQTANVHTTTYLAGPRYHLTYGRFQPYLKGLIGFGQFNYPYNYGTDNDLVIAPGGGVDFRVTHRFRVRLADFEYQYWPQFHYGAMSAYSISSGIRVRIF
jgi:hypothetical protein